MHLRIATCRELPEPDSDEPLLADALRTASITATLCGWDDPTVDWHEPVPTLIRSTWNYPLFCSQFLRWCERVAGVAPLLNPLAVVQANWHKRYLIELQSRGIATVPTLLVERGEPTALPAWCAARGWDRIVIKPAVGAASYGARAFRLAELAAAEQYLMEWSAAGDMLVQPYVASVDDYGERSLILIDGVFCHAIRKAPRLSGSSESVSGPVPIADDELALAQTAVAPWQDQILYGRVDLARGPGGRPAVMEMELIEPSLYLSYGAGAAERLVAGLTRRLGAIGVW